jgi:uncharacterized RDD family membrane protein YckC
LPTGGSIACGGEDDVTTPALETASWARRVLALFVDWFASTLAYSETGSNAQLYVLLVYVVESALFTWLLGGSFGKLATRLRVVPADGRLRPLNPLKALLRQAMIALVIPPLVYRSDGRGLHDLVAGTVTVTLATFRGLRPGP